MPAWPLPHGRMLRWWPHVGSAYIGRTNWGCIGVFLFFLLLLEDTTISHIMGNLLASDPIKMGLNNTFDDETFFWDKEDWEKRQPSPNPSTIVINSSSTNNQQTFGYR
jgi:hypothetical protein